MAINAIKLYRHESDGEAVLEYNFYDNQFAPSNLVVRKIFLAMLESTHARLNRLELEYNDLMIAEKLGRKAAEVLRFLGASSDNMNENRSGDILVSRTFEADLSEERSRFFYELVDLSDFMHYRLKEGKRDRIVFYFSQYLMVQLPFSEEQRFYDQLQNMQVPFQVVPLDRVK